MIQAPGGLSVDKRREMGNGAIGVLNVGFTLGAAILER